MKALRKTQGAFAVILLLAFSSAGQEGRDIARRAYDSAVLIVAENGKAHRALLGSGFFIRNDLVITNYHVIKGSRRIKVKLVGRQGTYNARVIASSPTKDLAVLSVIGIRGTPLPVGDVEDVAIGDKVYAIGNPEGLEATFSDGMVSAIRQSGGNSYFQISAPISEGSSGGPILNSSGEVIAVAVGGWGSGQNLNFAIPVSEVAKLMDHLGGIERSTSTTKPYLVPRDPTLKPKVESPVIVKSAPIFKKRDDTFESRTKDLIKEVREQPGSAKAHFALALAYQKLMWYEGGIDGAIRSYKRAIELNPQYEEAYMELAEFHGFLYDFCYVFRGDIYGDAYKSSAQDSANYFREAIRINPDRPESHEGLCRAYSRLNRYDEAISSCEMAIGLKQSDSAFALLASIYSSAKRYDEAIKAYTAGSKLDPNDFGYEYEQIGKIYIELKQYDRAITSYQTAVELGRGKYAQFAKQYWYKGLVQAYVESSRLSDGIQYFKKLVLDLGDKPVDWASGPTTGTQAHYSLGMLCAYAGDTKGALDQFKILKVQGGAAVKLAEQLFDQIYKKPH